MGDFNLKKFLIENKMTRNSRLLNESQDDLRRIWEKAVEDDRDNLQEDPPGDPEVSNNFEQAVADARDRKSVV